jgi:hypothetical protein
MEDVGIPILWEFRLFYDYLVYFTDIWYILWKFCIFFPFWYFVPGKIWQTWAESGEKMGGIFEHENGRPQTRPKTFFSSSVSR